MAGYSQTPLAKKLGISPGSRLSLDLAPAGWSVPELPEGVAGVDPPGPADVVIAFFREEAELPDRLPALAQRIFPAGSLWVAWPRRAGGHQSDITENALREHACRSGSSTRRWPRSTRTGRASSSCGGARTARQASP